MFKSIKKVFLGIFGGMAILLLIAILLFVIWVGMYIAIALSIFLLGYFLVTQYIDYKSDSVKKVDTG
jgi:uncharacterized protein involved in cysteine biosynthesis